MTAGQRSLRYFNIPKVGEHLGRHLGHRLGRLLALLLSVLWLGGCSGSFVSSAIVRQSINLYLNQTQSTLSEVLQLPPPGFEVKGIHLQEQEAFLKDSLPTYHLQGTYDLRFLFPHQSLYQANNPFDLYLQQQAEGESWRLLIPAQGVNSDPNLWQSYLVNDPDQTP